MSSPCCSTILSASCKLERKGERDGAAFIFITTQLLRRPFSPEKELKRKHCTAWAKFIHFASNGSLVFPSLISACLRVVGWLRLSSPLLSSCVLWRRPDTHKYQSRRTPMPTDASTSQPRHRFTQQQKQQQ